MHLIGENLYNVTKWVCVWGGGGACLEYAKGQKIYVYGKNVLRELSAPPLGYIHVRV